MSNAHAAQGISPHACLPSALGIAADRAVGALSVGLTVPRACAVGVSLVRTLGGQVRCEVNDPGKGCGVAARLIAAVSAIQDSVTHLRATDAVPIAAHKLTLYNK